MVVSGDIGVVVDMVEVTVDNPSRDERVRVESLIST
jgi:hypothetical protein